jgi:hypothetical protein
MATLNHDWAPRPGQDNLYQANGTAEWHWQRGDGSNYCAFSIRPMQANMQVEVLRQWTVSDNNLVETEHFQVQVSSTIGNGGGLMFNTIAVVGS